MFFFKYTFVRFVPKDVIICSKYTCGSFHISKNRSLAAGVHGRRRPESGAGCGSVQQQGWWWRDAMEGCRQRKGSLEVVLLL